MDRLKKISSIISDARKKFYRPSAKENNLIDRGKHFHKIEMYTWALESFDKVLLINPNNFDIWCEKATIHIKKQDYQKAVESFDNALKIEPENQEILLTHLEEIVRTTD
ncbi:MAG: tetratricopeptide repeat protein [Methanoregula sp.]|nr:tetratricopeptide repeat protein [Methanoregula sp.]